VVADNTGALAIPQAMCRLLNRLGYGSAQPVLFAATEKAAALAIVAYNPGELAAAREEILP
jgi:hypothetical protein